MSLNPQPLPPGPDGAARDGSRLGDTVSLNPQPLPPGPDGAVRDGSRPGDSVSLNPQPLPPGPGDPDVRARRQTPGSQSGIIIVSGQPDPLARKSPGAGRVVVGTADAPPVTSRAQSAQEIDFAALAAKGPLIASQDPLAVALRNQQAPGPMRTGFDIGMAVAEGHTLPGPGKQHTHDLLGAHPSGALEQQGYDRAVTFSVQRNANAPLAAAGARVAAADQGLGALRNSGSDIFYRLGFDIASGLYGDPALGALGGAANARTIRAALNSASQQGFDASAAFLLRRSVPR